MRNYLLSLFVIAVLLACLPPRNGCGALAGEQRLPYDFVNPFIGTGGHGHTYPGATLPFGMVQLSPDAGTRGWDWCSGYHYSDTALVGFSHTHLSGTGCADLCDILFLPTTRSVPPGSLLKERFTHTQESAAPGYYRVRLLDSDIDVELTCTERVGFHRYRFPETSSGFLMIDLGYGNDDTPLETSCVVEGNRLLTGHRFSSGWAKDQKVYFVAEFSTPWKTLRFAKDGAWIKAKERAEGKTTRAVLTFDTRKTRELLVKVAISAVSVEGAHKNLSSELSGWDFDAIHREAQRKWSQELSKFRVFGGADAEQETFYTALYHTMLAPTLFGDVDGYYRGVDGKVHQSKEFKNYSTFSLWDTYRAAHPLYTIFQQERVDDWIGSMLAFYHEGGLLPVWPLAGCETQCMIGYHAVPVLADAVLKGFRKFESREILEAMKASAFQPAKGLEFYRLAIPQDLDTKLRELQTAEGLLTLSGDCAPPIEGAPISGYARRISGETIHYHSCYPYVKDALLTRAISGNMSVEWETRPVSLSGKDKVTFMWVAGHATGKGGHRFDLFANGAHWVSFNTSRDTTRRAWTTNGEFGVSLTFCPLTADVFDDLFGLMYLTVPASLLTEGEPLRLRVTGEAGNSPDWFMTFEHIPQAALQVEPVYALARENQVTFQFIRLMIEHVDDPAHADILVNGLLKKSMALSRGLNTVFLPLPAVERAESITVAIVGESIRQTQSLTLNPVVPYEYIPADEERESVSKTLEYAYDDWCIARIAHLVKDSESEKLFAARAQYYRSLFDPVTGFMRGRKLDRTFVVPFDPRFSTLRQPEYTEGNAWQYSWYVPQDIDGLIQLHGGKERFAAKLDTLFNQSSDLEGTGATADVSGLIGMYAHGNEPSHHIAYLYNYADQPWKTQELARRIMREFYTNQPDGLCGNEDCGQMSAWYVFSAMGFYPVNPCGGMYDLGSPLFDSVQVDLGNGKFFTVIAENQSETNAYVQEVTLNERLFNARCISHQDIMNGGTLKFVMGSAPKSP